QQLQQLQQANNQPFAAGTFRWHTPSRVDYSSAATKGAVVINYIPVTVTSVEVTKFMERIGPITQLQYPVVTRIPSGPIARCKYENNEMANRALRALSGRRLGGVPVAVFRAKYWYTADWRKQCTSPLNA
ncbi:hypothetical protein PFISCL1PPCAC_21349, partial [Pristionchus fissidentatus]